MYPDFPEFSLENADPAEYLSLSPDYAQMLYRRRICGMLELTNAVRPMEEAFLMEGYQQTRTELPELPDGLPTIVAAVSREKLFDVFMACVEQLGENTDVLLDSLHDPLLPEGRSWRSSSVQQDRLRDTLGGRDVRDLLLHDGHTGISVISKVHPMEVTLPDHKTLLIHGRPQDDGAYEDLLSVFPAFRIRKIDSLITMRDYPRLAFSPIGSFERLMALTEALDCDEVDASYSPSEGE